MIRAVVCLAVFAALAAQAQEPDPRMVRVAYELFASTAEREHPFIADGAPSAVEPLPSTILSLDDGQPDLRRLERFEYRVEQILYAAEVEFEELQISRFGGTLLIQAVGSAQAHASLSAALPGLQAALDSEVHAFSVRLLRSTPGAAAEEVARAPVTVLEGVKGESVLQRAHTWQNFEVDQSGSYPRLRVIQGPLNEGVYLALWAKRTADGWVDVRSSVDSVALLPDTEVLAWPNAGEAPLPAHTRFRAESTVRMRPGSSIRLAERVQANGAREWIELHLAASDSKAPVTLQDVCLSSGAVDPVSADVRWSDSLDTQRHSGSGGGGFSFEEEPELSGSLAELVEDLLTVQFDRWVLPDTPERTASVQETLRAWDAAHPQHRIEVSWGPAPPTPPTTSAKLPLQTADQLCVSLLVGTRARLVSGSEHTTLRESYTAVSGPEGKPAKALTAPVYDSTPAGMRCVVDLRSDGVVALRWNLASPIERVLTEVDGLPYTRDSNWRWQGEAEVGLEGSSWTLVGEAQRPDGTAVALYARIAPQR